MLSFRRQRSDDGGHKRLQKSPEGFIDLWKNHSMASGKDRGRGLPRSRVARGPAAVGVDHRLDDETAMALPGILGQVGEDGENSRLPDAGHRAVRRNMRAEWRFQDDAGVAESSAKGMLVAVLPSEYAVEHSSDIDAPFPITPGLLVWEEATLPIATGKPDLAMTAIGINMEGMCPVAHVRGTDREQGIDVVVRQSGLRSRCACARAAAAASCAVSEDSVNSGGGSPRSRRHTAQLASRTQCIAKAASSCDGAGIPPRVACRTIRSAAVRLGTRLRGTSPPPRSGCATVTATATASSSATSRSSRWTVIGCRPRSRAFSRHLRCQSARGKIVSSTGRGFGLGSRQSRRKSIARTVAPPASPDARIQADVGSLPGAGSG